jgi:hypothetical protein
MIQYLPDMRQGIKELKEKVRQLGETREPDKDK